MVPIADVDPLLPHGIKEHSYAVQGLGDIWHGHCGTGSPEAEQQVLDVVHAAGEEHHGSHQGPDINALQREARSSHTLETSEETDRHFQLLTLLCICSKAFNLSAPFKLPNMSTREEPL